MKQSFVLLIAGAVAFGMTGVAQAQQSLAPAPAAAPAAAPAPKAKAAPKASPPAQAAPAAQAPGTSAQAEPAAGTPPPAGWVVQCASASRGAPLDCAIRQNVYLVKTGQNLVVVNIRITPDTRAPVAQIQLPLGLNLPAGAKLQVDEGKTLDLQIQTCEASGCSVNTPIAPDFLAALRSAKQLKISFQSRTNENITIPMPMSDFAAAYDKVK